MLKEEHCGDESEVAEAKRKGEKIDVKQREVQEEYLKNKHKRKRAVATNGIRFRFN